MTIHQNIKLSGGVVVGGAQMVIGIQYYFM
jgi:hypothetical protein